MNYIKYLKDYFPSKNEIYTEIINLKAILNLPKGTEHFVSDLHGEYDAFQHVLRNGSGMIIDKITSCFQNELSSQEVKELATLIYYPEEKLQYYFELYSSTQKLSIFYKKTIQQFIQLIHFTSTKYTRSKVRKALPKDFTYITEELLYKVGSEVDKDEYYDEIISEVIKLKQAPKLIIGLANTIKRLVVDHLHVVGDIYDRGPAPDKIIDTLMAHHSVDIQWGNHDITWIGAATGSDICIMNVLRISARYNNLDIIENTYGINLRPLVTFAEKYYQDNMAFRPKIEKNAYLTQVENLQITQIHQAVAIIQFKLESALIKRRPEFNMNHRLLLEKINFEDSSIVLNNKKYLLENTCFKTIDPKHPTALTTEEQEIIQHLVVAFTHSEKLRKHTDFLMEKGSLYLTYNGNLLIHGCIPLNKDGSFKAMSYLGKKKSGKDLLAIFETSLKYCYKNSEKENDLATDMVWYLWTGECSSLFGKKEMTTFERYFIRDKSTHKEEKNSYYTLRNNEDICKKILNEFHLDSEEGHIINGHTPVKEIKGENPIKANKKMIVIDGGFSKPYQSTTGIAGYTLLYNSYGMQLVAHQPFTSKKEAIENGTDILSTKRVVDRPIKRKKVRDTDTGQTLLQEIDDLMELLEHFN